MEAEPLAFNGMQNQKLSFEEFPSQISEFLASARATHESLLVRQKMLEEKLSSSESFIDEELEKIQSVVNHFQNILIDAGAQEWRIAAEAVYKEGKQQAQLLQGSLSDVKKTLKESCAHLDGASSQLVKGITRSLSTLRTTDIEQLAEDTHYEIKNVANTATKQLVEIGRWFYWKNLLLVLFLSLIVVLFTGLFIDDEWPWESHKNALKERVAGQALLEIWPQLSLTDQQRIMGNIA